MKNASTTLWLFCIYGLCSCQYFLPNELSKRKDNERNSKRTKAIHVVNSSNTLLKNRTVDFEKSISQETLTFNVKKQAETLLLHWTIKKNNQTKVFVLERSSDGEFYEVLTTITDNLEGNFKHYSYTDIFPLKGIAHYRLRQIYRDGSNFVNKPQSISSNIRKEKWMIVRSLDKNEGFHLTLNPFKIEFPIQLQLFNEFGEKLHATTYNHPDIALYHPPNKIDPIYTIKIIASDKKVFIEELNLNVLFENSIGF